MYMKYNKFKKGVCFILICYVALTNCLAQNISPQTRDSLLLYEQRIRYLQDYKNDSILHYANQFEQLALRSDNESLKAKSALLYGFAYNNQSIFWSSYRYLTQALGAYKAINDSLGVAETYYVLGNFYRENRLKRKKRNAVTNLAMKHYRQAIAYLTNYSNHELLGLVWIDYGVNIVRRQSDSAFVYYQKALALGVQQQAGEVMARCYVSLADLYLRKKWFDPEKVKFYANQLATFPTGRTEKYQLRRHANIAYLYWELKNYKEAIYYFEKALPIANRSRPLRYPELINKMLYECYGKIGDLKQVLSYNKKVNKIRNEQRVVFDRTVKDGFTVVNEALQNELNQLAQITQLKEEQIQLQNWMLGIGIVLTLLLITLLLAVIKNHRSLKYAHKQVQSQKSTIESLLKEMPHRIKNNLQTVISLLSWQQSLTDDEEVSEQFQNAITRIQAVSLVHHKLYRHKSEEETIDFKSYIENLCQDLFMAYGIDQEVELNLNIEQVDLDFDNVMTFGLILNELISNSTKYAFSPTKQNQLSILLSNSPTAIQLKVKDNGLGFPATFIGKKNDTLGLELVQSLVHKLKGSISFENDEGAKVSVEIPYALNRNE